MDEGGTRRAPSTHTWRYLATFAAIAAIVLALDVVTKVVATATLAGRGRVPVLDGLLTLHLIRNPGAAFSIGGNFTMVFTAVSFVVAAVIVRVAFSTRCVSWAVTLGFLLGGALGNLADRLLRPPAPLRGHVVDWIQLPYWPVFNLADVAIVSGGVLAVILAGRGLHVDGTRARKS